MVCVHHSELITQHHSYNIVMSTGMPISYFSKPIACNDHAKHFFLAQNFRFGVGWCPTINAGLWYIPRCQLIFVTCTKFHFGFTFSPHASRSWLRMINDALKSLANTGQCLKLPERDGKLNMAIFRYTYSVLRRPAAVFWIGS